LLLFSRTQVKIQMQKVTSLPLSKFQRFGLLTVALIFTLMLFAPLSAFAGTATARKLTLSNSAASASSTWTFTFTPSAATALNGIAIQLCNAASGSCTAPGTGANWTNAGSAFSSLTYNGSSQSSWALDNVSGYLRAKNNASVAAATGPIVLTFSTVTNPDVTNTTFYGRMTTYTGDDFTGALDTGVVAASTSQAIALSGTVDETLVFCTGASGANCGAMTSATGTVAFNGTFSSSTTRFATSTMLAGTNGGSGYTITVNSPSSLTCAACAGTPTIAAMGTQTANGSATPSSTGTAQFGLNLRANTAPTVGTDKSGGSGLYGTNYGTVDSFRFLTADSVATAAGASDNTLYTVSYIVNIPSSQAAGVYTATMTYICTATF
jgi:hypothetical protein